MSFNDLPKPFFVLAPMDDVTDTVFRQIVASTAPPDLFFTEFTNVDGLQSPGRTRVMEKLRFAPNEGRLIAQLWGKNPENFYKTAQEIASGSLAEELAWYTRRSGSDKVQGSKEERESRTQSTVSEPRARLTQQFAESDGGADGSAVGRADTTWMSGTNFAGIDLNMGCPSKSEVQGGTCSALIKRENWPLADEIMSATKDGLAGMLPLSVKTRLGFSEVDLGWHEFLLGHDLTMLAVHGRTRKEMSKVPAHWDLIGEVRSLRDKLAPQTLMVGNGDVLSRAQGEALAAQYRLDGIMIGRGIFQDPFVFANESPWTDYTRLQKLELFRRHVQLFIDTWRTTAKPSAPLNKFCKTYVNGFDGAKELREQFMSAKDAEDLLARIAQATEAVITAARPAQ